MRDNRHIIRRNADPPPTDWDVYRQPVQVAVSIEYCSARTAFTAGSNRVLDLYYYNEMRTHLGLSKDAPIPRAVQRSGAIITVPILSGLHHHYARI
jgi:hypothetical protein